MWFVDACASGFQLPTDPGRLQWFRIIFGAMLSQRFALALAFGQGGWDRFASASLSAHLAERFGTVRTHLLVTVYRPALIVRTAAALALALGLGPRLALLVVLPSLANSATECTSASSAGTRATSPNGTSACGV
ncbi:hypothetical protein [Streptomyces sp. NPDC001250]|uniref:hypothetical protein n=1 Tax=unclassified Streptomyces TaxID=2593676 RepID=UPI003322016B